jgi:glycosyltransferase involved in cell wall biosynthesis
MTNVDKEKTALISVIIPVYNTEKYVERAINSVLNQSYRNVELVIVDDGSTDMTGDIIDRVAKKDTRVVVIHKKKEGVGVARNRGLNAATGSYITFCDADDEMYPNMLEKMMHAIIRDGSDVAVCDWEYVDTEGRELFWYRQKRTNEILESREAQERFLTSDIIEGFCWNKLVDRKLYRANNVSFAEDRISYCDMYANYKIIKEAKRVSLLRDKLYKYYQIPTSCVHVANIQKDYDYISAVGEIVREAQKEGLEDKAEIYALMRIYKHLYGMLTNCFAYDEEKLRIYYKLAYEKYCSCSLFKMFIYSFCVPIERPFKFIIKGIIVWINYLRKRK